MFGWLFFFGSFAFWNDRSDFEPPLGKPYFPYQPPKPTWAEINRNYLAAEEKAQKQRDEQVREYRKQMRERSEQEARREAERDAFGRTPEERRATLVRLGYLTP